MKDEIDKQPSAEARLAALEEAAEEFRGDIASCDKTIEESVMVRDAIIDALSAIVVAAAEADGDFMARFQLALKDRHAAYKYRGEPAYADMIASLRALNSR